ncbi:CDP-glycerol--glycerophosphate glycerophosphotransferase [Pradoshia eiseniae]|uniref:CDP-glycerol--glycerophosphate glycerophosphotransferase n=1 Tax=Pradoshia eiseniae TaxID=2064768 RepID=A0A2S7N2G2_9BACI|nr:CDP-glycerol glycerophosphotransferase family protein [Pradoshia eiseniae]PQD96187.1 CDP-glycerol--glycerophosphate glycerophosphotransferase [Pradoshia eiseniae]
MSTNISFGLIKGNVPYLSDEYYSFNGTKSLIARKKFNTKYNVYKKNTNERIILTQYKPMTIVQTLSYKHNNTHENIVLYVDTNQKLSYVRIKRPKYGDTQQIIEKAEKTPFVRSITFILFSTIFFLGVLRVRNYTYEDAHLSFGYDKSISKKIHFLFPKKIREKFALSTNKLSLLAHTYWCITPAKNIYEGYIKNSEINVPVFIQLTQGNMSFWYPLKSDSKHIYNKKHYIFSTRSTRVRKTNNELFIRKSITGQYVIVITSLMSKWINLVEKAAYFMSKLSKNKEVYDIYFEKFSQGASESGFELFKYAFENNKNAVYILDRDYHKFQELKNIYGNNLVAKNSFRAFYYIFLARSFQSSDLVSHIQRRLYDNDSLIKRKILACNKKIMLQHGVCLCTNIFERGYFNKKVPITPDYLLVNSKYERDLFIQNTEYHANELMVTGLPNLDLYVKEKNNTKKEITFLLTWRPWDITGKIEEGSYIDRYLSFLKLIQTHHFYSDKKVNIILHPKSRIILEEQFPDIYKDLSKHLYDGDIKEALINSKVVISDYSSIIYYAFAGGSNIILYWQDKELAESQYGSKNILQEEIAFGDIVYEFNHLHTFIEKNYSISQPIKYVNQYNILVSETSGTNTKNTYDYIKYYILKDSTAKLNNPDSQTFNSDNPSPNQFQ